MMGVDVVALDIAEYFGTLQGRGILAIAGFTVGSAFVTRAVWVPQLKRPFDRPKFKITDAPVMEWFLRGSSSAHHQYEARLRIDFRNRSKAKTTIPLSSFFVSLRCKGLPHGYVLRPGEDVAPLTLEQKGAAGQDVQHLMTFSCEPIDGTIDRAHFYPTASEQLKGPISYEVFIEESRRHRLYRGKIRKDPKLVSRKEGSHG